MSTQATPSSPEIQVLEGLIEACRQFCRNPSFEVRKAALDQEAKLERQRQALLAKLNPVVAPAGKEVAV